VKTATVILQTKKMGSRDVTKVKKKIRNFRMDQVIENLGKSSHETGGGEEKLTTITGGKKGKGKLT